jgi:diguanylate cyclase (GGDEF)-like protein/PAS domain S-box-containing protein
MQLNDESYQKIFDVLSDGLYFVDRERIIRYWNKAAELISGFTADEVIGKSCMENILNHVDSDGNSLCKKMCPLAATIQDGTALEARIFLHHKDGHRVPISVRVNPLHDAAGKVIGGVEVFTDISSYEAIETRMKELEGLAMLDNLTQLANRNYLEKELLVRVEEERRFGVPFGILFMDIDHFKIFNDTYGHELGDRVLRFVATTLVKNSRSFDLIGRWGGEEFIGIIRNVTLSQLEKIGEKLRILIGRSFLPFGKDNLHVTISIGATLMRENDTIPLLLKRADALLYTSKMNGRNRLTSG